MTDQRPIVRPFTPEEAVRHRIRRPVTYLVALLVMALGATVVLQSPASAAPIGSKQVTARITFNLRSCPDVNCSWNGGVNAGDRLTGICTASINGWHLVYQPTTRRGGYAPNGHLVGALTSTSCSEVASYGGNHTYVMQPFMLRSCPTVGCSGVIGAEAGTLLIDVCRAVQGWHLVLQENTHRVGFAPTDKLDIRFLSLNLCD